MTSEIKIGFVGAGNMAGAIIDSIISSDIISVNDLYFFDTNPEKIELFRGAGLNFVASNNELVKKCDVIFLAVKPQVIDMVLQDIKDCSAGKNFVSIAAGISVSHIKEILGDSCNVIRVLPNTPMLVLKGATVIAKTQDANPEVFDLVVKIFKAAGVVEFLDEELINNVIPVSSSSPAFFFRFIEAMAKAGSENGIDYDTSLRLAVATMHGAAHILEKSGKTPEELIAQVSSPGGTTIAALSAFDDFSFESIVDDAFKRCINRADELGK